MEEFQPPEFFSRLPPLSAQWSHAWTDAGWGEMERWGERGEWDKADRFEAAKWSEKQWICYCPLNWQTVSIKPSTVLAAMWTFFFTSCVNLDVLILNLCVVHSGKKHGVVAEIYPSLTPAGPARFPKSWKNWKAYEQTLCLRHSKGILLPVEPVDSI